MKPNQQQFKRMFAILLAALVAFSYLTAPQAQSSRGDVPERAVEEEQVNLSELHYRDNRATLADEDSHDEGEGAVSEETVGAEDKTGGEPAPMPERSGIPHWNSAAGRAAAADQLAMYPDDDSGAETSAIAAVGVFQKQPARINRPLAVVFNGQDVCTMPTITVSGTTGGSYQINDQLNGVNVWYRQPYHVFTMGSDSQREQAAQNFADTVRASKPMFLPYKNSHVYPGQGWIYNSGDFHGAIDFSRDNAEEGKDPTFGVYSVADGTVVSALWSNLMGNVVIIEHKAPNGDRYRTAYMHLRNGFTNDLANAQAMPSGNKYDAKGNVTRQYKYYLFAQKPDPNPLYWGTDSQTIKVKVGDKVNAGTQIGWSGNTGWGGAGWGLDDNGNPTNKATANNHLHLMTTVPDPRPSNPNDWVQVDPFGVYAKMNTNCYDLLDDAPYERLFAPFYSSFHNVPAAVVSKYFGYYPGMGMALQTLSLHRKSGDLMASGSFQSGLPSQWKARLNMSGSSFQSWFDYYDSLGYRPREISVNRDGGGNPRYTVIWKKRAGEGYYTYFGLTGVDWNQKVTDHVTNGGMVIDEHVVYDTNSGVRHTGVFVSSPKPETYDAHSLSNLIFNSLQSVLKAQGYKQTNIDVEEIGGLLYGGIWRKVSGEWAMEYDLTPQEYQDAFMDYRAQGYRLYRVQGYADSGRFAAIWTK